MRKCALINTWCNSQLGLDILSSNIDKVKEKGLDVILISPSHIILPIDIVDKSDFVIYSKENPISQNKFISCWKILNSKKLTNTIYDYGYASLIKYKRLVDFAVSLDYNEYYLMIYDTDINENFDEIFSTSHTCSFFSSKKGQSICGNLMIFNKENAIKFSSLCNWDSYFDGQTSFGEDWLYRTALEIGGYIHEIKIDDLITTDPVKIIDTGSFSIFIQKNENPSILFFNIKQEIDIYLNINGKESKHSLFDDTIIPIDCKDINKLYVKFEDNIIELTTDYNNILESIVEFV